MPKITGKIRADGKVCVQGIGSQADEVMGEWIVDSIPDEPKASGKNQNLIYDPKAKKFEFEETERSLTEAEALIKVAEALEKIAGKL
jgi:hypothetical protein